MAYRILPGVKQDHRGRLYQNAVYPNGKLIVVPYIEEFQRDYPWMERIEVESKGKPGTTYLTLLFYHQKG